MLSRRVVLYARKTRHSYEPHSSCSFCLMCIWFPLCFLSNVSDQFLTLRNSLMQWSVFLGPTSASSFGTISNNLAPARIILQMKASVLIHQLHKRGKSHNLSLLGDSGDSTASINPFLFTFSPISRKPASFVKMNASSFQHTWTSSSSCLFLHLNITPVTQYELFPSVLLHSNISSNNLHFFHLSMEDTQVSW